MELKDQVARDTVAQVLDKNLMVLAGAGAGKTYALVQRMVNAVRTGSVGVDRLAAITFTRKAAGEMRGRFFMQLKACAEEVTGEEAERVRVALEKVDQCFIGTIHSFCGQLLRERPVEAGLPPDFSEVDDREEAVMRREAWDRFVQRCFIDEDVRLAQFEELGLRTEDLYSFFQRRCQFSDVKLKPTVVDKPDLETAVLAVEGFLERAEMQIPDPLPGKRDTAQTALMRARLFLVNRGIESDADRLTLLQMLHGRLGVTLKGWAPNNTFAKEFRDVLLPEFQEEILEPVMAQWRQYVYQYVADFVDDAVASYGALRRQSGRLTFQDLLEWTAIVLRDSSEVRAYFQDKYRCLFVDEFQDTDPIQAETLMYLTGEDVEEKDWRKLQPKKGSLFLVGDGKQSIYRFRRADVETFRLVTEKVVETGGEVVQLNTSFRSLGHLCDWVNTAFEPLFAADDQKYQADFGPLFKFKSDGADDFSVRKLPIGKVYRHNRGDIAKMDADRIADFIAAALKGETEFNGSGEDAVLPSIALPGDFLILTRTAGYLSHYAEALEARGIPFDMTGGSRLGQTDEVRALVDFLETIYMPDDPLPLLAYLRGDWVGLGDDDLYAFKRAGGAFDWTVSLPNGLDDSLREKLDVAFGRIYETADALNMLMPAAAIERCLDKLGLMAFVRALPMGATRSGNLLRVLALIRQWQSEGMHWGQVVTELRAMIDDAEYKVEQMTLASGQTNVVRLMNLHQSKGLQGKVVFLADPYDTSSTRFGPEFHVSRASGEPFLALPVSKPKGPFAREVIAEPIGWAADEAEEAQFLKGEELRLLYVAATRAENLLVVSKYDGQTDRGPWAPLYPFLESVPDLDEYPSADQRVLENLAVDLDQMRMDRDAFWERVKKPSYEITTVTTDREDALVARSGTQRGAAFGTVVHKIFDDAIHKRLAEDVSAYVRYLLVAHGGTEDFVSDILDVLADFRASDIWQDLETATAVYTEVPFAVSEADKVTRGVIDLVYQMEDGWHIVDYKTDAVANDDEVAGLVAQVSEQINTYAQYWETFTSERVVVKELWLTEQKSFVGI
ncbi:MAG: UvrD-helicase domain-containing protein [Candidatus Latescibacteria bacterium]|nr:UvrD-helicase domain-containing protein [Candidatus Latescibacterota bacterium]